MAKQLGTAAIEVGKAGLASAEKNLPVILDKLQAAGIDLAGRAVDVGGQTLSGIAAMMAAVKEGSDLNTLATEQPDNYLDMYNQLEQRLGGMGVPTTPSEAEAVLGVWESEAGQNQLKAGAQQAGISPAELQSMTQMYVLQSQYVDTAVKAKEAGAVAPAMESRKRLKQIIHKVVK